MLKRRKRKAYRIYSFVSKLVPDLQSGSGQHDPAPASQQYLSPVLRSRSRLKCTGSGLLLCDIGVLRWQSCDNSYNFSQIITICTSVADPDRYLKSPPGSGSAWRDTDPDPDPGGISLENVQVH